MCINVIYMQALLQFNRQPIITLMARWRNVTQFSCGDAAGSESTVSDWKYGITSVRVTDKFRISFDLS